MKIEKFNSIVECQEESCSVPLITALHVVFVNKAIVLYILKENV